MGKITRRLFLRGVAAASTAGSAVGSVPASPRDIDEDDGPLLADDVTGTTAFADWHERKYGFRPE